MNRLLISFLCLLTLAGCGNRPLPPLSGDARHRVQQQLDRCLVQISETRADIYEKLPRIYTHKETALVIKPDGTALVQGAWGYPPYVGEGETRYVHELWMSLKVRLANGRWVAYKQVAASNQPYCSLITPVKPLKNQPYLDITKIRRVSMGMPVYVRQTDIHTSAVSIGRAVANNDPDYLIPDTPIDLLSLAFSTRSGEFLGWHYDTRSNKTQIMQISQDYRQFIEKNAHIKFTEGGLVNEPVDPQYGRVYNPNSKGICLVQFAHETNPKYRVHTAYAITPSGDLLTNIPLEMWGPKPEAKKMPAVAILPDGSKAALRWIVADQKTHLAILRPVKPLNRPLAPVVWAVGSKPQLEAPYYSLSYGQAYVPSGTGVGEGMVSGYDRKNPDRFVIHGYASLLMFNQQGQVTALNLGVEGFDVDTMEDASTSVRYLTGLVPGLKLKQVQVTQHNSVGQVVMPIWQSPRIWAWITSEPALGPRSSMWRCSAICIDPSGYFVMPIKNECASETSTDEIRRIYSKLDDTDYIRDENGEIGQVAIIYDNAKLGITIGKMVKPPLRAMKAISLAPPLQVQPSEQLYGVDVGLCDKRLQPYLQQYKPTERTVHPEYGYTNDDLACGYLCVRLNGQVMGYVTVVQDAINHQKTIVVPMSEIAKKLAYVKKALGDK
ncbi:MAG: hypothetical protein ACYC1M_18625 [Armatimonadota bacterium]